jgi:isopentenyl-diphosphate delta-isomerase
LTDRKKEHIELALRSQTGISALDSRFTYEPLLNAHPDQNDADFKFLGKTFKVPIWVSSMTGGTPLARTINENLARVCKEFGMGMGLGSCRSLLGNANYFNDFNLREVIGDDRPLFANLGISQVEQALMSGSVRKIHNLVDRLKTDGLIIHVNPLQEWLQPEGDRLKLAPIDIIKRFLDEASYKVIVKEVGQGMGKKSIEALLKLPLEAIEFAAYGGTNFALVELMREDSTASNLYEPFTHIGVTAEDMLAAVNSLFEAEKNKILCQQVIISGGIKDFLDGYYFLSKSKLPAIYGQASVFLKYAREGYEPLFSFVDSQVKGLKLARNFLRLKE